MLYFEGNKVTRKGVNTKRVSDPLLISEDTFLKGRSKALLEIPLDFDLSGKKSQKGSIVSTSD